MKRTLIFTLAVLLTATFHHQVFADNTTLAKEVMFIHDEAMAKMTHMHELKLQLKEAEKQSGQSAEKTLAIEALQNAHKGMMGWMHQYKAANAEGELETVKKYLLEEKMKIQTVSNDIDDSIDGAEKLLGSLSK